MTFQGQALIFQLLYYATSLGSDNLVADMFIFWGGGGGLDWFDILGICGAVRLKLELK